jgi:hypothetical protein
LMFGPRLPQPCPKDGMAPFILVSRSDADGVHHWWQAESGRMSFRDEPIKFAYYRLRYQGTAARTQ